VLKHSHINWSIVKSIFVGVGSVVAASTLFLLAANWVRSTIDSAVERKLSDPTILRRIAAESRPSIVFDAKESILADLGGAQFIKTRTVTRDAKDPELPRAIDIDFTTHLPIAPLLTPLHRDTVVIHPERGKGFTWRFNIEYQMTITPVDGYRKYRLELIR